MSRYDREVGALADQVSVLLEAAYRQGFEDGGATMRDNILKAAGAPVPPASIARVPQSAADSKDRAPRGTVRALLQRVLKETPGLTSVEAGKRIAQLDLRVSPTSASNELARYEGKRYRKEDGRWFLIGHAEKETAEEPSEAASADVLSFERG